MRVVTPNVFFRRLPLAPPRDRHMLLSLNGSILRYMISHFRSVELAILLVSRLHPYDGHDDRGRI